MPDPTQAPQTNQQTGATPAPAPEAPQSSDAVAWDPKPDTTDLLTQATKLGGPLGGLAIGSLQGAHAHENQASGDAVEWDKEPDTSNLNPPMMVRYAVPGQGIRDFQHGSPEEKEFLAEHPQAAPRPYPTGSQYMADQDAIAKEARGKAGKALAVGGGAIASVLTAGAALPLLEGTLGTVGGAAATGALSGGAGSVAKQALSGENPVSADNLQETGSEALMGGALGGIFGLGGKLLTPVAKRLVDEVRLLRDGTVTEQGIKDGIIQALESKTATPRMADDAYALLENQTPRPYSDIGNELKLVKPKLDARIDQNNLMIQGILDVGPQKPITNAAAQITRFFDDMSHKALVSMSRTGENEASAIAEVRNAVVPKLTDEMSASEVNAVRQEMDNHIKTWDPKIPLNGAAKQAQEAYRMARFKLADMVKDAQPATKPLFEQWHNDINLNELLDRKFHGIAPDKFWDSYQAYRKAAQAERIAATKKFIIGKGAVAIGLGAGYHALNPFGH